MPKLFDRELSRLAFDRRFLYELASSHQPVLERLLKFAQLSAALDEYFMVRVPFLKQVDAAESAESENSPFATVRANVRSLMIRQQAHFNFNLKPALAQHQICLLDYEASTAIQQRQLDHRFEDEVISVLAPLITPPSAAIPDFSNLSLNLAVSLAPAQSLMQAPSPATTYDLAWVKVPRSLPRFMLLQGHSDLDWVAVPLEQIITAYLPKLFPNFRLQGIFPFRVTRSADLGTLDSETTNRLEVIQDSLQQRQQQGMAVRLESIRAMPNWVRSRLIQHLEIASEDFYPFQGWLGLSDLRELTRLPRPDLQPSPWHPYLPASLTALPKASSMWAASAAPDPDADIFEILASQDLLIHLPYHSFAGTVEQFVAQAAADSTVLTIKTTLYRTSGDAPIVRSLINAAKEDKQIVALVELTASLDEAINIQWAKSLEKAGAHVVYGVVGLKTHTNLVLIVRREAEQIRQYAYIGTGDYLPSRPQTYEDVGLLTSRPEIGRDLSYLFNFLTGCSHQIDYPTLMVAPQDLRSRLKSLIEREAEQALAGKPARLIAKLNLLADPDIIDALYQASQAGVEIDLIVRGICRLRPGVSGLSDRIRVVSILGRFVEHSRILYCHNGGQSEAWIGTADWTPRGLDERIEVMVPIHDTTLTTNIRQWLDCWLADNQNAWVLQPDGRYLHRQPAADEQPFSAHEAFMELGS